MLLQRFLTALLLAPLAILIVLWPPIAIFALICAATFLAAWWEWAQLSGLTNRAAAIGLLLAASAVFALLWWGHATVETPLVLLLGVSWWLVACVWLNHFAFGAAPTNENRRLKLLVGSLIIFPAWIALVAIHDRVPHGHWWTLLALIIVWSADIGAYFSGRAFGKRKLAPQVSPGKTRAGAYGALVAGTIVAVIGGFLLDVRGGQLIGLGVLACFTVAASIVGDLIESLMKRHAKVKDSGSIFPGHGGLLDRMDSVFAAMPVFATGLWLLGL